MFARKLIVQGADAYLTYIMDTLESRSKISQVHIVREFMDVFPEELPSMPKDKEIEFSIDLEAKIAPISCRPYKMAPLELKDLKE